MNTALVLFNGVWIWIIEILSSVSPTLALALESSWYHFCSVMRNHKHDSIIHESLYAFFWFCSFWRPFHYNCPKMTISEGSWLWYHILSSETQLDVLAQFIIYFDLENVSNQSQTLVLLTKVELIIEILLFIGSKLAKDDNVIWIWTVVPHLVCMCGGLWISFQLICIGADINVSFSVATIDRIW